MYPVEETVNSCFFNPNLGKSPWPPGSPGGPEQSTAAVHCRGYLPLGRPQDSRVNPEMLAEVTQVWGLRAELGSPAHLHGHV